MCKSLWAQEYHFPVNPGRKAYLTGSVGEIRRNHFHAGLDVGVVVGTPVYAADDGYVYRVKVSTYGYGRVIYIDHPRRKHRTVYAHLNRFNESIGDYVREKQYEQENFEIELFPDSMAIPVRKGQVIGYTGNSGSSGGPHLHYEIRDWNDVTLNPMQFGFKELPSDRLPPVIRKIALASLDTEGRVNGVFGRSEYAVKRTGPGLYSIPQVIPVYG
ncbi:MAG: M23 family metallopeptidase, partial [Bacteroidota bacterium]